MGKWGSERQLVVHDAHSSQRALVYDDADELRAAKRMERRRWVRSCCCLLAVSMVLLLMLLCLGLIVWVTFKPKAPRLSLRGITLHDIKVLEMNATTSRAGNKTSAAGNHTLMYLNSTLFITASNPNRVSATYSAVNLNITYNDVPLDTLAMPPFRLQAHGNVSIATPLSVNYRDFFQADGQELLKDARENHLPLRLRGLTTATVSVVGFKSHLKLNMDCDIVIQYQDLKVQSNVCHSTSSKL